MVLHDKHFGTIVVTVDSDRHGKAYALAYIKDWSDIKGSTTILYKQGIDRHEAEHIRDKLVDALVLSGWEVIETDDEITGAYNGVVKSKDVE